CTPALTGCGDCLAVLQGLRARHDRPAEIRSLATVAGPIKSPSQSLVGAASDRTPSFSVCAFAVELGPHHGTRIRYPCSATNTRMIPPPRASHGTFTTKHFLFRLQIKGISTWRRSHAFSNDDPVDGYPKF